MAQEDVDFTIRARQEGVREASQSVEDLTKRMDALDETTEETNDLFERMTGVSKGTKEAVWNFAKAAAGAAADVAEMVLHSAKAAEQFANMAATTGFGVEQLQVMKLAAHEASVSLETIETGALRLERALENNSKAFAKYGLDANQLMAMPVGEAFEKVVKHISEMGSHTEKVAAINDLFGKGAAKAYLPLIDAMEGVEARARILGVVMGKDQVAALIKLDDAADDLQAAWAGLLNQFSAALATPEAVQGVRDLAEGVGALGTFIREHKDGIQFLVTALEKLATIGTGGGLLKAIASGPARIAKDQRERDFYDYKGDPYGLGASAGGEEGGFDPFERLKRDEEAAAKRIKVAEKVAEAERKQAQRVGEAWIDAAEKARKKWEDFGSSMERSFAKDLFGALKQVDQQVAAIAAKQTKSWNEYLDMQKKARDAEKDRALAGQTLLSEMVGVSDEAARQQAIADELLRQEEKRVEQAAAFQGILQGSAMLVGVLSDRFGDMLQVVANIAKSFESWDKPLGKLAAIAGGVGQIGGLIGGAAGAGAQGAAGGATLGASIGTLLKETFKSAPLIGGILGGVVGFIGGIFGNSKKKAEELKKKQDEAVKSLEGLMDAWRKARTELAEVGASGVNKVLDFLGTNAEATSQQLANGADYVAASFAMLRAAGLTTAQALTKLKPSLDALAGKGALVGTAAEPLAVMANFAAANEGLLNFVAGLGEMAQGLAGFGLLTQELATKISLDMGGAIQSFIDKGLSYEQALALSAQDLYNLDQAAKQSGTTLDAHTQQLIEDAKAAGLFTDLEDPMKALVEINKGLLTATAELVKLFGGALPASVQKLIDEFNSANVDGGAQPATPLAKGGLVIPRAANGILVPSRAGGSLVRMGEAGQPELAAPVASMMAAMKATALEAAQGQGLTHVHVYVGGQKIDEYIARGTKDGRIRVHQQSVRVW